MTKLAEKKCIPCQGGVPPLSQEEKEKLLSEIGPEWQLTHNNTRLLREFKFKQFKKPLEFTNIVGAIAEEQFHHPEIHLGWGHLEIEIWTHKINDLVESDFIYAAKVNEAFEKFSE